VEPVGAISRRLPVLAGRGVGAVVVRADRRCQVSVQHEDWEARFAEAVRELLNADMSVSDLRDFMFTVIENWAEEKDE
jgi:hypothetical protein